MNDAHSKLSASDIEIVYGSVDPACKVRIQVSMHSRRCSGRYLEVICSWLDQLGVCDLEIQLSDTLQRYNIAWREALDPEEGYLLARERGDEWLRRNRWTLEFCHKNFEKMALTRWDYWTRHVGFVSAKAFIDELLESDREFRELIDRDARAYLDRIHVEVDDKKMELSQDFLCEEVAVSLVTNKFDFATELYPGSRLEAERYLAESYPDSLPNFDSNFVGIEFRSMAAN